jgi:hypothetical protein
MFHHPAPRSIPCRGRCLGIFLAVFLATVGFLSQVTLAHSTPTLAIVAGAIVISALALTLFRICRH